MNAQAAGLGVLMFAEYESALDTAWTPDELTNQTT